MARGLFIGSTDFSIQSLNEIKKELKKWSKAAESTLNETKETIKKLNGNNNNYFEKVAPYNFKSDVHESMIFYENVIEACDEIITGLESEFQKYHVRIAENIGKNASSLYRRFRKSWKDSDVYKYYEDANFGELESIYKIGSDMLGDLIDFNNLVSRLEDFVDRKDKKATKENLSDSVSNKIYLQNSSNISIDNKIANSDSKIKESQKSFLDQIIQKLKKISLSKFD